MGERTLSSWKEIAAYLGCTVRTAQRYAVHRDLPLHRLPGGSGRVTTTTMALDKWRQATKNDSTTSRTDVAACHFRWLLDRHVTCDVKISGGALTIEHLNRLRQYLNLVETALQEQ